MRASKPSSPAWAAAMRTSSVRARSKRTLGRSSSSWRTAKTAPPKNARSPGFGRYCRAIPTRATRSHVRLYSASRPRLKSRFTRSIWRSSAARPRPSFSAWKGFGDSAISRQRPSSGAPRSRCVLTVSAWRGWDSTKPGSVRSCAIRFGATWPRVTAKRISRLRFWSAPRNPIATRLLTSEHSLSTIVEQQSGQYVRPEQPAEWFDGYRVLFRGAVDTRAESGGLESRDCGGRRPAGGAGNGPTATDSATHHRSHPPRGGRRHSDCPRPRGGTADPLAARRCRIGELGGSGSQ